MQDDRGERAARITYLRMRAEELRVERDHYWQAHQADLFTTEEISSIYRAIAREMREVASELRLLVHGAQVPVILDPT